MERRSAVLGSRLERQRSERQHGLPQPTAREVRGTHAAPPWTQPIEAAALAVPQEHWIEQARTSRIRIALAQQT
jgi:hypothetical protein